MSAISKRWCIVCVVFAMVLVGAILFLCRQADDKRFCEGDFDRIQENMSELEVEKILGMPAGDYRATKAIPDVDVHRNYPIGFCSKEIGLSMRELDKLNQKARFDWEKNGVPNRPGRISSKSWFANEWGIVVAFDEKGFVVHAHLLKMASSDSSGVFFRLKRYLRRLTN